VLPEAAEFDANEAVWNRPSPSTERLRDRTEPPRPPKETSYEDDDRLTLDHL